MSSHPPTGTAATAAAVSKPKAAAKKAPSPKITTGAASAPNTPIAPNATPTKPQAGRPLSAQGSRTPRHSNPAHQISPQFQPRTTRSRVNSIGQHPNGVNGSPRPSRKTAPGALLNPNSPGKPNGPPRRKSGVRVHGSMMISPQVDLMKRRHRRTMSDTPTSPFWSPSFEFLPSEDPEVELEDEKFVASMKVDEVEAPSEDLKGRDLFRSISFPVSLRAQHLHSRGASYGGSMPGSPTITMNAAGVIHAGAGAKSASPVRRRQSLKSPIKGRVPCSPRTQALNRLSPGGAAMMRKKRGSAVRGGLHTQSEVLRRHAAGVAGAGQVSPAGVAKSPTTGAKPGRPATKVAYVPVSTQRAQRARRQLPKRATTDLTRGS